MKIAVLGCGAVGSLYAAALEKTGQHQLLCVVRSQAHADSINESGITITEPEGAVIYAARPRGAVSVENEGPADLVLIAVKSYSTAQALSQHSALFGPDTIGLTLQNGYGNHNDLKSVLRDDRIILGTTAMGVNIRPDGRIVLAGKGPTVIGSAGSGRSAGEALDTVKNLLNEAGFETRTTDDPEDAVLNKLFINVGINAVCSLNDKENRYICGDPDMKARASALVLEAVDVVNTALGRSYRGDEILEKVMSVARSTGNNVCSMLQDVRSRRTTEIDRINGAVLDLAASAGIKAPENEKVVSEIKGLYAL